MRAPLTFISLLALAWLLFALAGARARIPTVLIFYFAFHFGFVASTWWALQSLERADASYFKLYFLPLLPALLLALVYTARACPEGPLNLSFAASLLAGWAFAVALAWQLVRERGPLYLSGPNLALLFEASVFFACGAALLASLALSPWPPLEFMLRLGLGLFWLTQGVFHFGYVGGLAHNRLAWIARAEFVPMLIAIVIFSALALGLMRQQGELSQAPIRAEAVTLEEAAE